LILVCAWCLGAAIAAVLAYQFFGAAIDRRRYKPRGRLVPVNGRKLHLFEQGEGAPAVVLEAGLAASSLSWAYVQPRIAQFTRTVSYDRAGLGWSEAGGRRNLDEIANELHQLLVEARVAGPLVLVGHSFGALIVRSFAYRYPNATAGLVLVDPVSIKAWAHCSEADRKRLALGAKLSRRGARLARLGVVRFAVAAARLPSKRITAGIARASAGNATSMLGRLVGEIQKLPAELVPVVRAQWCLPKPFHAMAEYLECLPDAALAASQIGIPAELPVTILSAANATSEELAEREEWIAGRRNGRHIQIPDTGHWLHLERPDVVAEAVREIVGGIRSMRHGVNDVIDPDAKS
jgi:pimeloyl-ACP methyl ester carboxylesterase